MKNTALKYSFIFCLILISGNLLYAQADTTAESQSDSLRIFKPGPEGDASAEQIAEDTITRPRIHPGKAALYSAILPGLGQVYNHKVWKVPVVYAALGGAIYGIWWNNREAQTFLDAFYEQTDPAVENPAFEGIYDEGQLINLYYQHRRWKDLSIILGGVAYGLQILDAYVDAHLFYYNINDNLSFRWEPRVINMSFNPAPAPGVGLTFSLK